MWLPRPWGLFLLCCLEVQAMDFAAYHDFGLDMPFEQKPRTKHDSGMFNPNGGMSREQMWGRNFAAEDAARQKYPLARLAEAREGVHPGKYTEYKAWNRSSVYPGTVRDWWTWAPAQYFSGGQGPANLIVFADGGGFLAPHGQIRATTVLANLVAEGSLEPTVAVFLNPGIRPGHPDCSYDDKQAPQRATGDDPQRSLEYDSVSGDFAEFLVRDILPVVEAEYAIAREPSRRAVVGTSSGGVGAFCAAWFRPDMFGLVAAISGSFVNIRGAHNLPWIVRNTLRKPLKVFLLTGELDMDNNHGSWPLASRAMSAALDYAGYPQKLVVGTGGHGLTHAGAIFPEVLLWLFKGVDRGFGEEQGTWKDGRGWILAAALAAPPLTLFWLCCRCCRRRCRRRQKAE